MLMLLRRLLARHPVDIPQDLWDGQLRALPLLGRLDAGATARLRALSGRFLAQKRMVGVAGLALTPPMQMHIATQACLPILHLGLHWYRGWSGIVVYPCAFRVRRTEHDEMGIAHEMDDTLTGESWDGGPVVLSWEDAAATLPANVVIHEFAHKLDLLDGAADGMPPFDARLHPGLERAHWQRVRDDAYQRLCAELDLVESELPPSIDPDGPQADPYYARLPLDPYAATDAAEFFAVSSETYFMAPERLRDAFPEWHGLLQRFYRG
jgi:Mlc titration factor MtfA (ptsG expression regulator)